MNIGKKYFFTTQSTFKLVLEVIVTFRMGKRPRRCQKSVISIGGVAEDAKSELFYSFEADLYS